MLNLLAAGVSFVMVFFMMPVMMRFAEKIGFTDKPNNRKIHQSPTPLIGGIVIFVSFYAVFFAFEYISSSIDFGDLAVFAAALLILAIGIIDDYFKAAGRDFPAWPKFLFYIAAATVVFFSGYKFHGFSNPFTSKIIVFSDALQYIFTVLWIFGVISVINFSDGIDGLAGGIAAICASALFIAAVTTRQASPALMAVALIGSILGFLKYNSHPAKVFMGDSGATSVGFVLAVISLEGVFKQATLISLFIPVLALGVPIFDNIYVVLRRFAERKPVYKADRMQFHYRLMNSGLSVKQVNVFIYLLSTCLCLVSIILLIINKDMAV